MTAMTLNLARRIIQAAFQKGAEMGLKPLGVAVVDARGSLTAYEAQDGSAPIRFSVAHGKAHGAIQLGLGSRAIFERAQQQPYFIQSVNALVGGQLVPLPGGVLIRDNEGRLLGAVGVSGDLSDNDEVCAIAGVEEAGLEADTGA